MIGLAVVLALAAMPSASPPADFTARMRDSATAAQGLQGPLDGTWTLRDVRGRPLYVFQITDPVGGAGPLEGAWRKSGRSAPAGLIDAVARRSDRLTIRFAGGGEVVRVRLRRRGDGAWVGGVSENGHDLAVTLRRSALGETPR